MSILNLIKLELQQVVVSIAPIVGVEVAIYDDDFTVIAATVTNKHVTLGMKASGGHIMRHVMSTRRVLVNEQPGLNSVCSSCPIKIECPELADVTCPIIFNNEIIGVISFTAFNKNQKQRLLAEQRELVGFVKKLSKLIASLVAEKELLREKDLAMQKMETVLSSINDGIIAINEHGEIINSNELAVRRLGFQIQENQQWHLNIINRLKLNSVLDTGQPILNREVHYNLGNRRISVMISAWPIFASHKVVGAVAVVRDMMEIHSLVNELTSETINYTMDDIITCNPTMIELKKRAVRVAKTNSTILITGESGTGKELLSRFIHAASLRAKKPFVAVNCAAIPDTLLESELFGYEEGAFTGAKKRGKPGKFELANGGTLFLDEIGDMPLSLQAKLLRVVEDRKIERIGGIGQIQVDVRIIAATNKNLEKLVEEREFREDLFFRLSVIPLRIPPLCERVEDISLLLEYFLEEYTPADFIPKRLSSQALRVLSNYKWPGNVRELRNCIEYALNTQIGNIITEKDLPSRITKYTQSPIQTIQHNNIMTLEEMEKSLISAALERFGSNRGGKVNAAKALGIDPSTLYRKIKRYNM